MPLEKALVEGYCSIFVIYVLPADSVDPVKASGKVNVFFPHTAETVQQSVKPYKGLAC